MADVEYISVKAPRAALNDSKQNLITSGERLPALSSVWYITLEGGGGEALFKCDLQPEYMKCQQTVYAVVIYLGVKHTQIL